jgi:peroxiredoxin
MTEAKAPSKKTKSFSLLKNIALFLIIFTAILAWKQRNMATGEAPAFQTTLINGEPVRLSSYQGKPLMLHFWASWCPICKFEEGSVSDLNNDKDLPLLTVAFQSGNPTDVKQFMLQQNIETWPVIVDQEGTLARQYGVNGVPATFFIDASGKIRFKTMGLTSKWGMKIRLWLTSHL